MAKKTKTRTDLMERMFEVEMKAEEPELSVDRSVLRPIGSYVNQTFKYVTEAHEVEAAVRDLLTKPVIGFDCETIGLDARTGKLRLVQLGHEDCSYIFDAFRLDIRALQPVFSHARRIAGVNLPFDLDFVWENGIDIPDGDRLYDCRTASQVKYAGTRAGTWRENSMAKMAAREAGVYVDKEFQNSNWGGDLSTDQLQYAAYDTYIPIAIGKQLATDLYRSGLQATARVEMRVLPAIVWMHRNGALINVDAWRELITDSIVEQERLRKLMNVEAGVNIKFGDKLLNWGSPQQVKKLFAGRGYFLDSTDEPHLIGVAAQGDKLADLMVKLRKASKRQSTYGESFLDYINPITGRIHAEILQIGASESGRMSCINPNLQNIPRDHRYRACFIAPDGWLVLGADYSQIELRLAAQIAQDAVLLRTFQEGLIDVHDLTAQKVIGIEGKPSKEQRFQAKAVNFGFVYGMGAPKFQKYAYDTYGVTLSVEQAQSFRAAFFEVYTGLLSWHRMQAHHTVETRTLLGRRSLEVAEFTKMLNYPVQGSAGDLMKEALARMWEDRHSSSALPYLVVHDEVLCYSPEKDVDANKRWIERHMVEAGGTFVTDVPIVAEAGSGLNWDEAKS